MNNRFLLKPIKFSVNRRTYNIDFQISRAIQILGDSGIGKSLLAQDFMTYLRMNNQQHRALVLDSEHISSITSMYNKDLDYVIIDNADVIMTDEMNDYIFDDILNGTGTYWIILGRKRYSATANRLCRVVLSREKMKDGTEYITVERK